MKDITAQIQKILDKHTDFDPAVLVYTLKVTKYEVAVEIAALFSSSKEDLEQYPVNDTTCEKGTKCCNHPKHFKCRCELEHYLL